MANIPDTQVYREWLKRIETGQIPGLDSGSELIITELLDYIEHLEGLVDSGCGAIDVMGVPGRMEVLNAARENEERRRKAKCKGRE